MGIFIRKRSFVLAMILVLLLTAVPVTGADDHDLIFSASGPFPSHIPGYGIEHPTPHPSLVARMNEKIRTDLGSEWDPGSPGTGSVFPEDMGPGMRAKGENRVLVLLVDFPDKMHGPDQSREEVLAGFNGPGTPASIGPHDSVRGFYERSSYGQLHLSADVYGWVRAKNTSLYYEQLPDNRGWKELVRECMDTCDGVIDYTPYDNDQDGDIDTVYLIWAGSEYNKFWWAICHSGLYTDHWDGLTLDTFVWVPYSWEPDGSYCPLVTNHETGHLLGLPDYYDYTPAAGPCGGLGGFDLMDGNCVDTNCFSKYLLGWIDPVVIVGGKHDLLLNSSGGSPDAVLVLPQGSEGSFSEFFMVQARNPAVGNDDSFIWWYNWLKKPAWDSPGLAIWHIDATLTEDPLFGTIFACDNSETPHKLVRLMEADGLEELEQSCSIGNNWDPADLYYPGQRFGPDTTPNSSRYDGSLTGMSIGNISLEGSGIRVTITLPPLIVPLPGQAIPPIDSDHDGLYEDMNGNGNTGFGDVVLFFQQVEWIRDNEPVSAFDFNGNGAIGFQDVVVFFNQVG